MLRIWIFFIFKDADGNGNLKILVWNLNLVICHISDARKWEISQSFRVDWLLKIFGTNFPMIFIETRNLWTLTEDFPSGL